MGRNSVNDSEVTTQDRGIDPFWDKPKFLDVDYADKVVDEEDDDVVEPDAEADILVVEVEDFALSDADGNEGGELRPPDDVALVVGGQTMRYNLGTITVDVAIQWTEVDGAEDYEIRVVEV